MTLEMMKRELYKDGFGDGKEQGLAHGLEQGIINSIEVALSFGIDEETAFSKVAAQYKMSVDEIRHIWEKQ